MSVRIQLGEQNHHVYFWNKKGIKAMRTYKTVGRAREVKVQKRDVEGPEESQCRGPWHGGMSGTGRHTHSWAGSTVGAEYLVEGLSPQLVGGL